MNECVAGTRHFLKITINRAFYRCSRQHLLKSNNKLSFSSAQPTIWRIKDTHLLSNKFTVPSWHNTLKSSFFHIQVAKRLKSFPFRTYIPRPKQYFNFLFASNSDVENELYGTPYLSTSEDFNSPDSPSRNCLNVFVMCSIFSWHASAPYTFWFVMQNAFSSNELAFQCCICSGLASLKKIITVKTVIVKLEKDCLMDISLLAD